MKGDSQRGSHFQSLAAAYSVFAGRGKGEGLLGVGAKKGAAGGIRGPRGFLKSGADSTVSWGTLMEFVRSVHLGNVTKLDESALPGGYPGRRDLGRLRGNGHGRDEP